VPGDWPCARFAIYRGQRELGQFTTEFRAEEFEASVERVEVKIGPNHLARVDQGLKLVVSGSSEGRPLEGEFVFRSGPSAAIWARTFPSRQLAGDEHHWLLADPQCAVEGFYSIGGERIGFVGIGYHDHRFGTGPAGGVRHWMKGRVLLPPRSLAFQVAYPREAGAAVEAILIQADAGGVRELPVEVKRGAKPQDLEFGEHLRLTRPRELEGEMDWTLYDATADGETSTALCEIIRP
jgi:hypothetical protein